MIETMRYHREEKSGYTDEVENETRSHETECVKKERERKREREKDDLV